MVEEFTDPMPVSMAMTCFSEAVELQMRANRETKSADLCHDREAQDKVRISANERIHLRSSAIVKSRFV